VFAAGFAAWRIDVIRMGGPIQLKAQQTSHLVADVLPPPAYVIEAYLESTLLLRNPADEAGAANRLAKLHDDYRTRLDLQAAAFKFERRVREVSVAHDRRGSGRRGFELAPSPITNHVRREAELADA